MSSIPEDRLRALRVAKLRALLKGRVGADERLATPFGTGAALVTESGNAAILDESATRRSFGGALAWALRHDATTLTYIGVCAEDVASHIARVASHFTIPSTVQRVADTTAVDVAAAPLPTLGSGDAFADDAAVLLELLRSSGAEPVLEHGSVRGEVEGLEVARLVESEHGLQLEIGIGRFDREISAMMNAGVPNAEALRSAVELVRRHRRAGGPIHPLRDLVPERWIRRIVLENPQLVGASALTPIDTCVEPLTLRELQPAAAAGLTLDGEPVVVVCGAGVDLDVVPLAADTRAAWNPDAELVIAGPARNRLAIVEAMSKQLARPARFVAVELPF